jgi:hypothetical protein
VQLLEGQGMALVSSEELLSGLIWSTKLGSHRSLADGLLDVMQHVLTRLGVNTTKPGALTPGLCLLSRGFVPGVRARGGRAELCVGLCLATAVIVFRSKSLQLWSELPALAPGARCRLGRSVGSGAPS